MLEEKINVAKTIIAKGLTQTTAIYCSFGKDSMVMLHLSRSMGLRLPVVFNRIPYMPIKQTFANQVIAEWDLVVHSFPPMLINIATTPQLDVINNYSLPDNRTLFMPVGVKAPVADQPFLCGLEDLMGAPRGVIVYPWDTILIGHKSSDNDPLFGNIPLATNSSQVSEHLKIVFPLRDFTDADIWTYTEQFNVPYNTKRYDKANGYREFDDITFNNDYYYACTKCMESGDHTTVECPKYGTMTNVSTILPVANLTRMPYMEK